MLQVNSFKRHTRRVRPLFSGPLQTHRKTCLGKGWMSNLQPQSWKPSNHRQNQTQNHLYADREKRLKKQHHTLR